MSDHTELDKASVEKFYRSACATLHDLEARLIEARARELFWRRALRRTVFSELVSQYGGEAPDTQPNEDDKDVGGPLVPVESEGVRATDTEAETQPAKDAADGVNKGAPKKNANKKSRVKQPLHDKRAYEKRPVHGADACVACWAAARNKSACVAHLYKPPCTREMPQRGKRSAVDLVGGAAAGESVGATGDQ